MPLIQLLAQQVASQLDIMFIYILEAHACDEWKLGTKYQIPQHKSLEERIMAAKQLKQTLDLPENAILVCDSMDNKFDTMYSCWPDRHLIVQNEIALVANQPSSYGYSRLDIFDYIFTHINELGISNETKQILQKKQEELFNAL